MDISRPSVEDDSQSAEPDISVGEYYQLLSSPLPPPEHPAVSWQSSNHNDNNDGNENEESSGSESRDKLYDEHDDEYDDDEEDGEEEEHKNDRGQSNSCSSGRNSDGNASDDSDIETNYEREQDRDGRGVEHTGPDKYSGQPDTTWDGYKHITISRDHTNFLAHVHSLLQVIAGPKETAVQKGTETGNTRTEGTAGGTNFHLQDYEMRLKLLEQQNKKRLIMARQEQNSESDPFVIPAQEAPTSTSSDGMMSSKRASVPAKTSTVSQMMSMQQISLEIQKLQQLQNSLTSTTWQVFCKLDNEGTTFLTEPSWTFGGGKLDPYLRGNTPVADEAQYLRQRMDIAFVIYRYYKQDHQSKEIQDAKDRGAEMPAPLPYRETIVLQSRAAMAAMAAFLQAQPNFEADFPEWKISAPIPSPFLFWYYYRHSPAVNTMDEPHRSQMRLIAEWIDVHYGQVYLDADALHAQGLVSESTVPFFIRPGEVVVTKTNKTLCGRMAISWQFDPEGMTPQARSNQGSNKQQQSNRFSKWKASTWAYSFDGNFSKLTSTHSVTFKFDEEHPTIKISDLDVIPVHFAGHDVRNRLERRGQIMWEQCRHVDGNLVAYESDADSAKFGGENPRFMIDLRTYKRLHSSKSENSGQEDTPLEFDKLAVRPEGSKLLVFPDTIKGYNLRFKTWQNLEVDRIRRVKWDKHAFEHLAIDDDTKELIEALVTTKLETERGTDLIQGKGNGLIILLHGGPGTGKTFTAESVAELAEKPLYRVTCGDIGTKPEQVEKYLESVLYLGKIWGCVVLLDEADVFLEERTRTDLERNALVSVFLRVLEYYEGILILTSNRVGTFDEAFKSRIQLSLHYENLTKSQRRKIWENFFTRLKNLQDDERAQNKGKAVAQMPTGGTLEDGRQHKYSEDNVGIDFDDIEDCLNELAEKPMNGREIRNAITTARQLAQFRKEMMSSVHLNRVIKVSNKFDKYMQKVQEGHTGDQIARAEGYR